MEQIVLIGQRGVGKSSLLARLQMYWPQSRNFIDLDEEIERQVGENVSEIFRLHGERYFREWEWSVFETLFTKNSSFVMAVGAGFPVDKLPPGVRCLWIQRTTDDLGRIFVDRPRLDVELDPLDEYRRRAAERAPRFAARADEILLLPEGLVGEDAIERSIFGQTISGLSGAFLTLSTWHLQRPNYLRKLVDSGFELRNDWLSYAQITEALQFNRKDARTLITFRKKQDLPALLALRDRFPAPSTLYDWPVELGPAPTAAIEIISSHEFLVGEKLAAFLLRLEGQGGTKHLKASPLIKDFAELKQLWQWQRQDPENRSALPRSPNGRWAWIRRLQKGAQLISFWKDSAGSAPDQPSLYQWLSSPNRPLQFAAVIGDPTLHSRTPVEQGAFFRSWGWPVLEIQIESAEVDLAFGFLRELGLRAAAVTAPLKKFACGRCSAVDKGVDKFGSVNTLWIDGESVAGTNTDLGGFQALVHEAQKQLRRPLAQAKIVVWGGGGTLPIIRTVLPHASAYALRTGAPRGGQESLPSPEVLVWAAGPRDPAPQTVRPTQMVVDLNYREDSEARAFAVSCGVPYLSGEIMFREQARLQREFFASKRT